MRTALLQMIVLGAGLIVAIPGVGLGDDDKKPQKQQAAQGRQDPAAKKARQKQAPVKVGAKSDRAQKETPRAQERRRAGQHVASAFPRTRNLLVYLEKNDARAFEAILNHSEKITKRREKAALRLAREHHPELLRLIVTLQRRFPRAYHSAVRDLVADNARLLRAKQIGDKEYDAALTEWMLRSKVRLVAAQMTVRNRPQFQKQLESLLIQGEKAKRRQVQLQIQRYRDQIKRLQRRLDQDPARNVDRQLRVINKRVKPKATPNKRRRK